ncbi:MAG: T9SS type A sorting domain-containing protein [Bacteroidota bacterium]
MLKKILATLFTLLILDLSAQVSISNYLLTTGNNASLLQTNGSAFDDIDMSIGTTILLGGSNTNTQSSTLSPIGFDFFINGTRQTTFNVTTNGFIGIGNFATPGVGWLVGSGVKLAPFLTSGTTSMGTGLTGRIHYKVIGSYPTRVCVIEFLNMVVTSALTQDTTTFQARLYEENGSIEYVYGAMRVGANAPVNYNIGFQFTNLIYQNINTTTNTTSTTSSAANTASTVAVISQLNSFANGSRKYYRYVPTPPNEPTNLTFSNITSSGMTLNWTDASNETGYALYRSLDDITYTWVANFGANSIGTTQTGLPAGTDIYWKLFSFRESIASPLVGVATTLPPPRITPVSDGNWNNPLIWSSGTVPLSSDTVEISTGRTVTISATGAVCASLEVKGNLVYGSSVGGLTVGSDIVVFGGGNFNAGTSALTTHALIIGGTNTATNQGNLTVDGIFDMNTTAAVTTTFAGNLNGTLSGAGSTIDFASITVNKGTTNVATIEVVTPITQAIATNIVTSRLTITNGTLKMSGPCNISPFYGGSSVVLTSLTGKLWLNNAGCFLNTTVVTGFGAAFIQGELRIDDGTITLGNGGNTSTITGILRINGGTLNVLGGLTIQNTVTSNFIMTGGNVNIDPQATAVLNAFNACLNINSQSSFTWSGGNITIIDPHSTGTGNAVLIASGGTKSVTGGTLKIGNGVSTTASAASPLNTSGFGINSQIDLYNVEISNTIGSSNTRLARLTGPLTVLNKLEIRSNAYLFLGNAATGATLTVKGACINDGVLAGSEPSGTQSIGTLSFEGTSAQTFSGAGSTFNTNTIAFNNNNGVTLTNGINWSFVRANLLKGLVSNGANLTIGSASFAPTIQIGGVDELTTAGNFSTIPAFNTTAGSASYIYGPSSSTLTTGSFNEMVSGPQTLLSLNVNDAQGLTSNRNITTTGLTLGGGNLAMGTNNLTIGTSLASVGTLTRTSGLVSFTTGTFTRWYATGSTPVSGYTNGFPLAVGANDRSVFIGTSSALTTGGSITVNCNNVFGTSNIVPSFIENGVNVDRRTNSNWTVTKSTGLNLGGATLSLKLTGQGISGVTNVADLRMVKVNGVAAGVSVNGSGSLTIPEVNRTFTQATFPSTDNYYFGGNATTNLLSASFTAVTNGDWNTPATWDAGAVPGLLNDVVIPSPFSVTVSSGTASASNIDISSGGTLSIAAGTLNTSNNITVNGTLTQTGGSVNVTGGSLNGLTIASGATANLSGGSFAIGATGGDNRTLNVNGTLNVSATSSLTINGNLILANGSTFNQSGGTISVDGNSGTVGTSVASGTSHIAINTSNLNCTAGTIILVDPPHSSYALLSTQSLRINTTANLTAFSGTHTFQFGDGVSTTVGNTNGFNIETKRSGVVPIQNVVVNAGAATGRWASSSFTSGSFGTHIKGNLTINAGSEFRHTTNTQLAIGGNIINNGILTIAHPVASTQLFTLGGNGYTITNAQTISGTGSFRNSTTASTGAFTNINITNGTGLTLATTSQSFGVSGTLTIGAVNITTGTNAIKINSTGTLSRTTGYIVGNLTRNFATGSSVAKTFEVGSATGYLPTTVTFPSITTAGDMTVSNTAGDHPQIATSCLNASASINRYWSLTNSGIAPVNYNITLNYLSADNDASISLSNVRGQLYNGSSWSGNTNAGATTTSATINGLTGMGDIQLAEFAAFPVSVTIATASTTVCNGTSVTFTATPTNGGSAPTYVWKKNGVTVGTNANTYIDATLVNNDAITCTLTSNSVCALTPTAVSNTVTMTVNTTVAGSVGGGTSVCPSSTSGVLTLTGNTGSVVRWESAVSPFSTWTTIANTTATYTSGALTQTTQFRAVVQLGSCTAANSTATTVTVTPGTTGGAVTGGTTICPSTTSGTLTLSGNVGSVVRWESSVAPFSTWTTIANTTTTYTSGTLTQTTQFRAVVQNGSCTAANSTPTTVTVSAGSVGGAVAGGTTICSGSTSAALTLSGHTGTIVRWESSVAPFSTWTTIANTTTTYTSGALTQTTQFRAVVQNGSCSTATSTTTTVTVDATSVGGAVTGGTTICSASTSGTLTLAGYTGTIVRWESSVAPFSTWTTIANTTTTYTSGALTQTTQFRAVAQSGSCAAANSTPTTVTVDVPSVGGTIAGGTTICSGSTSAALTLSGNTGSVVRWESSVAPFSTWTTIANTTTTYTSGALTQTTQFRAIVQNGSCATASATPTTVTVTAGSVGGAVTGGTTICSGLTSAALTLAGHTGTIVRWESSVAPFSTWTTIANTTTTYTSGALTQTTQFRAVIQNGSCATANATPTTVTITAPSVGGTVAGGTTICSGATSAALTLSGNTGSVVRWESSVAPFSTWTTIANTTTTYTSGALTQTTQFRAVVQNGSCATANATPTTVTVDVPSVGGAVAGGTTICAGSTSAALTLSGHTGTIVRWESSVAPFSTWTTIANTTTTYTSGALTQTTQFRAVVQSGSCNTANATPTTVTVNPGSVGGTVAGGTTICSGATSAALTLSGNTGTVVRWESSVAPFSTWTTIANTTTTYTSGALTQTTQFRAVVQNGSCVTANSTPTTVTVDAPSVGGTIAGGTTICSGSTSAALTLSGHTGTIVRWESSVAPFSTWTTIANTTTTYTSGALTQTTQFRAVVQSGSCTPANATPTTVTVTAGSVGGTVAGGTSICSGSTSAALTLSGNTGSVVSWESSVAPFSTWTTIANTTTTYTSNTLTQTTQFRAVVQSGSCATANATPTTVTVSPGSVGGTVAGGTTICSGATSAALTLSGHTGSVVSWESSVSPFSTWTTIANTTTSYTSGALTQTTQFRAVVQSGSCTSAASTPTTVTVGTGSIWTGTVSGAWSNAGNWCGSVPTVGSDVTINSGTPNNPIITTSATINNLTIASGASLTVTGAGSNIAITGTITNNGTFTTTGGTVIFAGSTTQTIPAMIYGGLMITGGSNKTLAGNTTVNGTLSLSSGTVTLGSNNLTIGSAGSISGGSTSSYIVTDGTGKLTQSNIGATGRTGSILYPVGISSSSYTPVSVNNAGTNDDFSVRVINGAYNSYTGETPGGSAIANNAVDKTWFVTEGVAGGSNASLSFQWNGSNELSGFTRGTCYGAHYTTTWLGGATSAATGSNPYTQTLTGVTSFSPFGVGSNGTLPVKYLSFNGSLNNNISTIVWATAGEINNAGFDVERSFDNKTFTKVAFVKGNGTTNNTSKYEYTDIIGGNNVNAVYYRLKQIDFDAVYNYSKTILLINNQNEIEETAAVYPNPFNHNLTIDINSFNNKNVEVVITDLNGKTIGSQVFDLNIGITKLDISTMSTNLQSGIYFVKTITDSKTQTFKVVKQ